jgi:Flp pilus assembly pilin Flp
MLYRIIPSRPIGATSGGSAVKTAFCNIGRLFKCVAQDDNGGEVIEYVLIIGLIIVATITTIAAFGTKVMAKWTSVNASM